jgi:membrane protein required for colicin V production
MSWLNGSLILDGSLVVIMFISGLLAMVRGVIREILSIACWAAAAGAALAAYYKLVPLTKAYFVQLNELVVTIGTVAVTFLFVLIIVAILTVRISDKALDSKIGALDRTLGFLFGLARGLIIAVVVFAFYDWLSPKSDPWIANAHSLPVLKTLRDEFISMAPDVEAWYLKIKEQNKSRNEPGA